MRPDFAKILAGAGALVTAVGISLVGYVLVLAGLYGLSEHYKDEEMKRNLFRWFIWAFVGSIVVYAAYTVAVSQSGLILLAYFLGNMDIFLTNIAGIIVMLVLAEAFFILSARPLKRVYAVLSAKTKSRLFNIAAALYWRGSLLLVVLVGFILMWISWLIVAMAFFIKSL